LPFEQSPTSPSALSANAHNNSNSSSVGIPVKVSLPERSQSDRRKLQVSSNVNERRRSASSIFSEMRKMSITNFDNLKSPGVGKINCFPFPHPFPNLVSDSIN
jgi:hypothetical protein